jgi:hypothetical protein
MQHPKKSASKPSVSWLPSAALALAMAGVLAGAPALARHPDLDLDRLSDGQIDALLQAELDDDDLVACGLQNLRAAVPDEQMFEIVMCALGDDGDDGSESSLDLDDLEFEMAEAGMRLEDVVAAALDRADTLAQGAPLTAADIRFAFAAGAPETAGAAAAPDEVHALKDGRINPGKAAVPPVKQYVRQAIQQAR